MHPVFALSTACDSLTLGLWFTHSELFRDKAVFDDLVNVLFLGEGTLVIEIHVAHLLADVWLVDTLWMVPNEPMVHQTLPNEVAIDSVRVRGCGSLLVATTWLNLILAQENSFAMYLLEGNVCRRKIIIVNSVLVESIHGRVCA